MLVVPEQLLMRHYETSDGSSHHIQMEVSCSLRELIPSDVHGGVMSGHFGEDKLLDFWIPTPKRRASLQNYQVGSSGHPWTIA